MSIPLVQVLKFLFFEVFFYGAKKIKNFIWGFFVCNKEKRSVREIMESSGLKN